MSKERIYRQGSIFGAVLLIGLGVFFLYGNLRPEWDPWPLIARYWPALLIFLGIGKLWDYFWLRRHPEAAQTSGFSGLVIALLVILLFFGAVLHRHRGGSKREIRSTESVELRGAEAVDARIEMSAGEMRLNGGASKLMEADFVYSEADGKPRVGYDVSGNHGSLSIVQPGTGFTGVHIGKTNNEWDIRLSDAVPLELRLRMGAGQGNLRLKGLQLTKLDIQIGAGELDVDLTGDWKKDLDASIRGGVGSATIRLPKNVGVYVNAKGGLGSITARGGLRREAGAYVNEAYGKSAVTLHLSIEGGIGEIILQQEP